MERLLVFAFFVLSVMPINCFGQANYGNKNIILIDPGHGGIDLGAIGVNGIKEKDVVLKIAKEIVTLNKNLFGKSYEIYLSRYSDTLITLKDRASLAAKLKADLFVSIHCNHSDNPNIKGIEVYGPKKGRYLRESTQMAYQLQQGLRKHIGFKSRGVKFANFQVLRETADYCNTVLLELGYLSNADEAEHFLEKESITAIALSVLSCLQIKK